MHYKVSISNPSEHFIKMEWTIDYIHQDMIHLQLPAWRPGRYELQNYAKNIRCFCIFDENGKIISFRKITKDCWEVDTKEVNKIIVSYEYYAFHFDAGGSFANDQQLYVNPVNCMMYAVGRMDENYEVLLDIPGSYKIACQLPVHGVPVEALSEAGKIIHAKNFDELADSPFIACKALQQITFPVNDSAVHFWFQGDYQFDNERLKNDTVKYALKQIEIFGDFPCRDYHFLYHFQDKPFRHGVEHTNSTVIVLGKSPEQSEEDFYNDLLAISCHEFFHLWNINRIRPTDMLPYDFTKENYSTLGYVYEGITTYYGDLMLMRSGVWSWERYRKNFSLDLKRHIENTGRINYSLAESSYDTWLDGYAPGVPGRKVSIYIEGMLAAFIADVMIIKNSEMKFSLNDVMNDLYRNFYKHGKGYTENDYRQLLEKYSGISFEKYFTEIIWGKNHIKDWLTEIVDIIGCGIIFETFEFDKINSPSSSQREMFKSWTGINE